jgi:hypothetical protein
VDIAVIREFQERFEAARAHRDLDRLVVELAKHDPADPDVQQFVERISQLRQLLPARDDIGVDFRPTHGDETSTPEH